MIVEDPGEAVPPLELHLRKERNVAFQSAGDISSAYHMLSKGLNPDICVLSDDCPIALTSEALKEALGDIPIAIVQDTPALWSARGALKLGAAGVVLRSDPPRTIMRGLRFIMSGERFVSANVLAAGDPLEDFALSTREHQVLQEICLGQTNKEIALTLDVQEVTIKLHVKAVCRKLKARNRTHAAMIARDLGIA